MKYYKTLLTACINIFRAGGSECIKQNKMDNSISDAYNTCFPLKIVVITYIKTKEVLLKTAINRRK